MNYKVIFVKGADGYITAECPAIPGCISQGRTMAEAKRNIREAMELCLQCYREDKHDVPDDTTRVVEMSVSE